MGQRLNLEITKGDKVLANCYYHWSGYTLPAVSKTKKALYILEKAKAEGREIDVETAVYALLNTGATIEESEVVGDIKPSEKLDRNDGIICTTEDEIENTRKYEEMRVTINLYNGEFLIDVEQTVSSYSEDEWEEFGYELGEFPEIEFNLFECSVGEFYDFADYIESGIENFWQDGYILNTHQ